MANGVGIGGNGKSPAIDKINKVSSLHATKLQTGIMEKLVLSGHRSDEVLQDKGRQLKNETAMEENILWGEQSDKLSLADDVLSSEQEFFSSKQPDEGLSYFKGHLKNEKKKEMSFRESLAKQMKDFADIMNKPHKESITDKGRNEPIVHRNEFRSMTLRMDELKKRIDRIGISFKDV